MTRGGGGTARHYAQAAFEVAREQRDVDGWRQSLEHLALILGDEAVAAAFRNPQLDDGRRIGLAVSLAQDLRPEAVNFLKLLVLSHHTDLIAPILDRFEELVAEAEGRVDLEVVSARELSEPERAAIRDALTARVGRETSVQIRVDPRIIGGLVIRQGDRVTDGSVRRRLEELREQLIAR